MNRQATNRHVISDIMSYNLREEIDREILREIKMIVGGGQMTKENQDVIRTERHVRNKSCTGKKLTMKWTVGE